MRVARSLVLITGLLVPALLLGVPPAAASCILPQPAEVTPARAEAGDRIHLKAKVMSACVDVYVNGTPPAYRQLPDREDVILRDSNDKAYDLGSIPVTESNDLNWAGTAEGDVRLPEGLIPGRYRVFVDDGQPGILRIGAATAEPADPVTGPNQLPFTGTRIALLAVGGMAALGLGGIVVWAGRIPRRGAHS